MGDFSRQGLELHEKIAETLAFLRIRAKVIWGDDHVPEVAYVLGSGLGGFVNKLSGLIVPIDFDRVPGFPEVSVSSHEGKLWFGILGGKRVVIQQGRKHCYEGGPVDEVVHSARVYAKWGIPLLVVTNAAGWVNSMYDSGTLMMIEDHNNLFGVNPLVGPNDVKVGTRFPGIAGAYSPKLIELMSSIASKHPNSNVARGVYAMVKGPSYETPAEVKALLALGVGAVGMSTTPEVIAYLHAGGRNVFGMSTITNPAGRVGLDHEEVKACAARNAERFEGLMEEFTEGIGPEHLA